MVEFAPATVPAGRSPVKMAQHGTDGDMNIEFYRNPVDGQDHIKFLIPGDKTFQPDYLVDDRHKERFAEQWDAYEARKDQFAGQTRLEDVAWLDEAMRNHFKAFNIFTVEMLAAVSDGNLTKLGPEGRIMRDKAQVEVQEKSKATAFDAAQAEKAAMQTQINKLEQVVRDLQRPRRGRPPKEKSDAA